MPIKKYSKVKFTLRKELIIILSAIVVMVVATILFNLPTKEEEWLEKWNNAGSTIVENKIYEDITFDELEDVIKTDKVVYVLFVTADSTGASTLDLVSQCADYTNVSKVYLIDSAFVADYDREETEDDKYLTSIEEKFVTADGETISLDSNPNFWVFQNGKLVQEINQDYITAAGSWNAPLMQIFLEYYTNPTNA